MLSSRRRTFVGLLSIAVAALAACGDGGSGPGVITGAYTLRAVNGDLVPATVYQDVGGGLDVVHGRMLINPDGTYTAPLTVRVRSPQGTFTETLSDHGTYTREGNELTLTAADGEVATAWLQGSALTLEVADPDVGDLAFRYVKD